MEIPLADHVKERQVNAIRRIAQTLFHFATCAS
jgi:hypothetical protein